MSNSLLLDVAINQLNRELTHLENKVKSVQNKKGRGSRETVDPPPYSPVENPCEGNQTPSIVDGVVECASARDIIDGKKHVCVCEKCPPTTIPKNEIVFGQIALGDHDLCLHSKCPKGTRPAGKLMSGLTKKKEKLCVHDKCPEGCLPFVDYVNEGGHLYNINNKKFKKKKNKKKNV